MSTAGVVTLAAGAIVTAGIVIGALVAALSGLGNPEEGTTRVAGSTPPVGVPSAAPIDMLRSCRSSVAQWATVAPAQVLGHSVSEQNPSGLAWDFEGTYPGGTWACGGPAGQTKPTSVVLWPQAGSRQEILADPKPQGPTDSDPAVVVDKLARQTDTASPECLGAMAALADTSYMASVETQNAAVADTTRACSTVGEYVIAMRTYPAAWGYTSAATVDGLGAALAIQSVCSHDRTIPLCVDAAAHGVL